MALVGINAMLTGLLNSQLLSVLMIVQGELILLRQRHLRLPFPNAFLTQCKSRPDINNYHGRTRVSLSLTGIRRTSGEYRCLCRPGGHFCFPLADRHLAYEADIR